MNTTTFLRSAGISIALLLLFFSPLKATPNTPYDTSSAWLQPLMVRAAIDFGELSRLYDEYTAPIRNRLNEVSLALRDPSSINADRGFKLLWERVQLEDALKTIEVEHELKFTKLRYRKGIEIVKMLYEKILSMDHHFSSLKAQQELLKISNPHNYPEFKESIGATEEKLKRKFNFTLPQLLQGNPFLSATFSIVGMMMNGNEDKEKKESQEKVACILDFTVRMYNDLNVIYYETGYLRDANLTLKKDCEALFSDCARQVGYTITLEGCRQSDDWERLYSLLDNLVAKALGENNTMPGMPPQADTKLLTKAETNLQFAIDRVVQFINRYSDFVNQGNEYYKKFAKIADSYENEKACTAVLPDQFRQLKSDIDQTLEKFNSAYRMPEVQGSKLKDMLYGTVE
jgi:hypothetical protein